MNFVDGKASSRAYYAWTKDFIMADFVRNGDRFGAETWPISSESAAGEERLIRDTVRDATRQEIDEINRENAELKQLVTI